MRHTGWEMFLPRCNCESTESKRNSVIHKEVMETFKKDGMDGKKEKIGKKYLAGSCYKEGLRQYA